MAAFASLPWLTSSDQFLKAIIAGGEAGARNAQLQNQASSGTPRFRGGGGGAIVRPSAYEQARTDALKAETQANAAMESEKKAAWDLHNSLISRGATPQEAYEQSGLGRFDVKQPSSPLHPVSLGRGGVGVFNDQTGGVDVERNPAEYTPKAAPNPFQVVNIGKGGIVRVNKDTGEVEQVRDQSEAEAKEPVVSVPVYPPGVNPLIAKSMGITPTYVRGPVSTVRKQLGTNMPPSLGQQQSDFQSEDEARSAGYGPGDIIRIIGVGKVRLK